MHFLAILLILPLVSTVAASPYIITAYLPGHDINGQIINAGGEALFLGSFYPRSYYPSPPLSPRACPPGNLTLFIREFLYGAYFLPLLREYV